MTGTDVNPAQFRTWQELLQARTVMQPDRIVYRFSTDGVSPPETISFAELERRARAIAAILQEHGASGQPVLLLHRPGLEFVAAFFACLLSGAIAVPTIPPRSPRHTRLVKRLAAIVRDARPILALTDSVTQCTMDGCLSAMAGDGSKPVHTLNSDDVDDSLADQWKNPAVNSASIACIQYTSGTTGAGRGVVLSHENLLRNSEWIRQGFGHGPESVGVIWLPPYHDMGLVGGILQPLYANSQVILMPPDAFLQRPLCWLQAITRYKATTSGGPNFAYEWCLRRIGRSSRDGLDLRSWEVAFNGSDVVHCETLRRFAAEFGDYGFRQLAFFPCYGLAEATLMVSGGLKAQSPTYVEVDRSALRNGKIKPILASEADGKTLVGCGIAAGNQDVRIVDPGSSTPSPVGEVGEIWVRSNCVASGYWAGRGSDPEPQNTFEAVLKTSSGSESGFVRTGDLGFLHDEQLFVTGRIKDQIIIRGQNYNPRDIEQTAAAAHPAVHAAVGAAFHVDAGRREGVVIMHEINRRHRKTDLYNVISIIREAVSAEHELALAAVVLVKPQHLPRTPSGKLQRGACREAYLEGQLTELAAWSLPSEPTCDVRFARNGSMLTGEEIESWLLSRLAAAIGSSPTEIDPNEPFARYGLDSISAVSLGLEIEEKTGRRLPSTVFWDYPSISELTRFLTLEESASHQVPRN